MEDGSRGVFLKGKEEEDSRGSVPEYPVDDLAALLGDEVKNLHLNSGDNRSNISTSESTSTPPHSRKSQEEEDEKLAKLLQEEEKKQQRELARKRQQAAQEERTKLQQIPWFYGNIDRKAAEALLGECHEDSFLVRASSVPDHYALSLYRYKDNTFIHTLIKPLDYGERYYQIQDSPRMFRSVEELVLKSPELLGFQPALKKRLPNSLTAGATKKSIQSEEAAATSSMDLQDLFLKVKQALEETKLKPIVELKETLKRALKAHQDRVLYYDQLLLQNSIESNSSVSLSDEDQERYLMHIKSIDKIKEYLSLLRLKGDEFRITHKGQLKALKIFPEGTIMFCNIKRTTNPEEIVPSDMSKYSYFNVNVVEGKEEVLIYEITSAIATHYIDQLQKIVPESSLSPNGGGCCIYWKNGKKSSFVTLLPDEREELIEVVGAHMKHFKQATIKQIQLIKDIYKCKSTKFDPTSSEHQRLLNRLWSSLMPEEQITGMVSPQWKEIGFQGNDPSTDFRGMGLLGLLNLIYFAEHYNEKSRNIIKSNREYPWATAGINLTHMLLSMLNINQDLVKLPPTDEAWHSPFLTLFYYANNDDTFDELYCQAYLLFDKIWVHMGAKYMDFSFVIKRLQKQMEDLLRRKPLNVNQLVAWIEQLQLSFE